MTVKELAKAFRMDINMLSSISGYSRQGLHNVITIKNTKNKKRFNSFLDHLQFISNSFYEQDITQARIDKNIRDKMIAELIECEPIE